MLFDVVQDYGESKDLGQAHPDIVQQLSLRFDEWWNSVQDSLVNERVAGPRINPFKERFWHQFGGQPSPEDLRRMDMDQNPATRRR
jgi:hypothetical protein